MAIMTPVSSASVPLAVKNTLLRFFGIFLSSASANSTIGSVGYSVLACRSLSTCACIAADTVGPDGTLQAVWLDNRNDPNDVMVETFQATSTDDGRTWTFQDISSAPWNPNGFYEGAGHFIGDYIGVAASPQVVYPVWTDGRNSTPQHADTDIFTNVEIPGP